MLGLVLLLVAVGIGLWALNTYVDFIDARIKKIINVVVIICVVIYVLNAFGVFSAINVPVPRVDR